MGPGQYRLVLNLWEFPRDDHDRVENGDFMEFSGITEIRLEFFVVAGDPNPIRPGGYGFVWSF